MKAKTIFDFQLSITESCLELQIWLFDSLNYLLLTDSGGLDFTKYRTVVLKVLYRWLRKFKPNTSAILTSEYIMGNRPNR